ncbi:MAG: hypothetical protein KGL39_03755 [Patescibacteria group bacterium]|nr:hypothetical protein [Patescibacteria group bacterium]
MMPRVHLLDPLSGACLNCGATQDQIDAAPTNECLAGPTCVGITHILWKNLAPSLHKKKGKMGDQSKLVR